MPLEWLFGRRLTPEEMLRQNQRALNRAMRDLDREKAKMEQQEKKIIMDIKKMAKEGQMVRGFGFIFNVFDLLTIFEHLFLGTALYTILTVHRKPLYFSFNYRIL